MQVDCQSKGPRPDVLDGLLVHRLLRLGVVAVLLEHDPPEEEHRGDALLQLLHLRVLRSE